MCVRVPVSPRGDFGPRGYCEEVSYTSEAVEKRNEALYGDKIRANLGDKGASTLSSGRMHGKEWVTAQMRRESWLGETRAIYIYR